MYTDLVTGRPLEARVSREDEVTSTITGSLQHLVCRSRSNGEDPVLGFVCGSKKRQIETLDERACRKYCQQRALDSLR